MVLVGEPPGSSEPVRLIHQRRGGLRNGGRSGLHFGNRIVAVEWPREPVLAAAIVWRDFIFVTQAQIESQSLADFEIVLNEDAPVMHVRPRSRSDLCVG